MEWYSQSDTDDYSVEEISEDDDDDDDVHEVIPAPKKRNIADNRVNSALSR